MIRARLFFFAALFAGCGASNPCGEPHYGGNATDEAWRTMVDGERRVIADEAKASTVLQPTEGQEYPASGAAPTLRWSSPLAASVAPLRRSAPVPGWRFRLSDLLIGEAWAHGAPVTGPIHLIKITAPGAKCPVQAITTQLEWRIPDGAWETLKASGGQALTLEITSAYLQENRISEGPFRAGQPRTFRIAP